MCELFWRFFMKRITYTVFIGLLSIQTLTAAADTCSTTRGYHRDNNYYGNTYCQKVNLAGLKVNGQLDIRQVTVDSNATINGGVNGYDLSVKGFLTINGQTKFNKLNVMGVTTIHGQTILSDSKLQHLKVNGQLTASGSQFSDTTVDGSVNLRDVVIKGNLTANTTRVLLNGVHVQNIQIKKTIPNKPQVVCLEKGTHVQGEINFEAGNGKVYMSGASKIIGSVAGGNVIAGLCPNQSEVSIQ